MDRDGLGSKHSWIWSFDRCSVIIIIVINSVCTKYLQGDRSNYEKEKEGERTHVERNSYLYRICN